ncbi:MAG TPA: NADH-quinone oxidoreductase subunit J [Solirubrobacteraceae bacterium]|jgi:NADH-quinone oxidoreductase subunit J|nr:NADH-quinone oxidoreductase subunit J [Solirubrobacteraceae bacterium]
MSSVMFFIAAIGAIAGAVGVITVKNSFYSVLALVGHLLSLAGLFLLLRAEFVAAAQVVVYAGAVMVLYVFVVSYVGGGTVELSSASAGDISPTSLRLGAGIFCTAMGIELFIALLGTGLRGIDHHGARYVAGFGSPQQIGQLLLTKFLFAFEASSFLLLIAAVGAVVLARRRGGVPGEDDGRLSVMELVRPAGTGTMAEGVAGVALVPTDAAQEEERARLTVSAAADRERGT